MGSGPRFGSAAVKPVVNAVALPILCYEAKMKVCRCGAFFLPDAGSTLLCNWEKRCFGNHTFAVSIEYLGNVTPPVARASDTKAYELSRWKSARFCR